MYQMLALLNGVTIAVMVSVNGGLSMKYGAFWAAVIIHIVGSVTAFLFYLRRPSKEKSALWKQRPAWIYLGGAVGVCTTIFQCIAVEYISITSVIALSLLGQTAVSLGIDTLGLFGMKKRPFPRYALAGLGFSLAGIVLMLDGSVANGIFAVGMALLSGISIVLSRTINARLSEKTSALGGALVNHLVGLPITILAAVIVNFMGVMQTAPAEGDFRVWIYLGGAFGVVSVMLFNITVPKVSALALTSLVFVGQIITGVFLDVVMIGSYSKASLKGGILIALGILVNMCLERVSAVKERRKQESITNVKRME